MSAIAAKTSSLDGATIAARIDELSRFSDDPLCLTRLTLSPSHKRAAECVTGWMQQAGMRTHVDGAGNVIGRYEAASADVKTLIIGSHIDTVRNAGRFDGNLGVIAGIAVVEELHRRGIRLPYAVEVVAFSDEEGVRFPSTLTGSRALAGRFDAASLDDHDSEGITRREALASFGADPGAIAEVACDPARTLGYIEVHIEQGPVLEARGLPLGIVTAINGATRGEVLVRGEAGHSGTLPMNMRRDALAAAAEMIGMVETRARNDVHVVATVGRLEIPNGAVNIVPGEVRFSLDVRSSSDEARALALSDIEASFARIAAVRGVTAKFEASYDMPATPCDASIMDAMTGAFRRCGLEPFKLGSGAGHDGMSFRGRVPVGMIFVRCRDGVSHNPAEYASPADMGAAANVLFDLLQHPGVFA